MRQGQSPGWLGASVRATILTLETPDLASSKTGELIAEALRLGPDKYIFSVSLLAGSCARVWALIELEASITAYYPRVHEEAVSPRQQTEQLSGSDTRAVQNYFRIPLSIGV